MSSKQKTRLELPKIEIMRSGGNLHISFFEGTEELKEKIVRKYRDLGYKVEYEGRGWCA